MSRLARFPVALMVVALAGLVPVATMSAFPSVAYAEFEVPEGGVHITAGTEPTSSSAGDACGSGWSLSQDGHLVIGEEDETSTISYTKSGNPSWPWTALYPNSVLDARFAGTVRANGTPVAMFCELPQITSIDCTNLSTRAGEDMCMTDMTMMFGGCPKLEEVSFGNGFDTRDVTSMTMMFAYDSSLASLDLSGFDTAKVTSMMQMLANCSGLTFLDISSFDTAAVTNMSGMFSGLSSLRAVDFGESFGFTNPNAAFPELTEDDIYTGKWVPGSDPRATEGAETAADLMGEIVSPKGLWVAQMKVNAPTQAWESLLPSQTTPDPGTGATDDPASDPGQGAGSESGNGQVDDGNGTEQDGDGEDSSTTAAGKTDNKDKKEGDDAKGGGSDAKVTTTGHESRSASGAPLAQTGDEDDMSLLAYAFAGIGLGCVIAGIAVRMLGGDERKP